MCDVASAVLVEQFGGDGRAFAAAGDERPPHTFRSMVDELLKADPTETAGRYVSPEERELREALGVR